MNAPVDVLAVMGEATSQLGVVYSADDLRKELAAARAAVAELIEALEVERKFGVPCDTKLYAARKRTDAALAHCGGAK